MWRYIGCLWSRGTFIYLGGERNVGGSRKGNKLNYSEGAAKKREGSGCAVPSDTARERYEEEEGVLRGAEETPGEKWKCVREGFRRGQSILGKGLENNFAVYNAHFLPKFFREK